jgi:SAM-dependent methyltransferase
MDSAERCEVEIGISREAFMVEQSLAAESAPSAQTEVSLERIMQIATGGWAAAILATASKHSVFTHVESGHDTVDAVARKAGLSPRGAGALLDGLVGLGLLFVSEGRYRNAPDASVFLVEGKPSYFGGFPAILFDTFSDWLGLPDVVRTGQPTTAGTTDVPENPFWERLVPAIFVLSVPVALAAAERLALAGAGEVSILDIGGGSGVYSAIWLEANRRARSTQIDWANVNRIARRILEGKGLGDRFRTVDGDFHTVDFGASEYDVAVYSHIAHQESPAANLAIFRKIRRALKSEGTLVISDFVVENDRSGPPFPLIFRSEMLVKTKEGSTWRRADYERWLTEVGFRKVEFQPTPSPATLVYAT